MNKNSRISDYFDFMYDNLEMVMSDMLTLSIKRIFFSAIFLSLVIILVPQAIPISVWQFWNFHPLVIIKGLAISLPIIIWGLLLNFILQPIIKDRPRVFADPGSTMELGLALSAHAGFFEEIIYRWLFFYNYIWVIQALNWLLLGFAGWPLIKWMNVWLFIPVSDFLSIGYLENVFYHPAGWFIGAALVSSNSYFRNQHAAYGWVGFINSWFIGLYFFFIAFNYSIIAAMIAHFLYDIACFTSIAIYAKIAKPSGIAWWQRS